MLNSGKFNAFLWNGPWANAANTAMLLKNNLVMPSRTLGPFQQFVGKGKRCILSSMQKFGEMCITPYRDNTHWDNLAKCGALSILMGDADGHLTATYWDFNFKTKKIILIRDMTFLQKSYSEYSKVEKPVLVTISYEGLDDEEELKQVPIVNQNNNNYNVVGDSDSDNNDKKQKAFLMKILMMKLPRSLSMQKWFKLQALYSNNANKILEQTKQEKSAIKKLNFLIDLAMVSNYIKPILDEPQMFNKAWNHPNEESHRK